MKIPTTSNLWIISFIGGLVILFFGISGFTEYGKMINEYKVRSNLSAFNYVSTNHYYDIYDKKENFKSYSAKYIEQVEYVKIKKEIQNSIDSINGLEKGQLKTINQLQKLENEIDTKVNKTIKILNEIDKENITIKLKMEFFKQKRLIYLLTILFGLGITIIGLLKITQNQIYRDKMLYSDYIKIAVKQPNCQSCNMYLEYDDSFDGNNNYCSFCYEKGNFTHQNISLENFKFLIKEQLLSKDFEIKEIDKRLNKIDNLIRWRKKFDWTKTMPNIGNRCASP